MVDALLDVVSFSALVLCIVGFSVRWHKVSVDLAYLGQVSDPLGAEEEAAVPPENPSPRTSLPATTVTNENTQRSCKRVAPLAKLGCNDAAKRATVRDVKRSSYRVADEAH
jgi:hypothetical protein